MPDMLLLTTGGVDGGLSATAIPVKLSFCPEKKVDKLYLKMRVGSQPDRSVNKIIGSLPYQPTKRFVKRYVYI